MRPDQLEPYIQRIAERREQAKSRTGAVVEAIEADTDMMQELVGAVRTLRMANDELHALVDDLRRALAARPVVEVDVPKKTRARRPPAEQHPQPAAARDEVGTTSGGAVKPTLEPPEAGAASGSGGTILHFVCGGCGGVRVTLDGLPPGIECRCGRADAWALKSGAAAPF